MSTMDHVNHVPCQPWIMPTMGHVNHGSRRVTSNANRGSRHIFQPLVMLGFDRVNHVSCQPWKMMSIIGHLNHGSCQPRRAAYCTMIGGAPFFGQNMFLTDGRTRTDSSYTEEILLPSYIVQIFVLIVFYKLFRSGVQMGLLLIGFALSFFLK